jgi:hypothetical protein
LSVSGDDLMSILRLLRESGLSDVAGVMEDDETTSVMTERTDMTVRRFIQSPVRQ